MSEVTRAEFEQMKQVVEAQSEIIKAQGERIDDLEREQGEHDEQIAELEQKGQEKNERIAELEREKRDLREKLQEERELAEKVERLKTLIHTGIEKRKDLANDVEELRSEGTNPEPDGEPTSIQEPETPLEDMTTVPERLLDNENPKRARFVAKDIDQYSHAVPAGRAIKAGEIRRVLSAREEGYVHTQTVDRVVDILDEMGQDEIEVGEIHSGNERVVVFSEECVSRIVALQETNHTVVTEGGVEA